MQAKLTVYGDKSSTCDTEAHSRFAARYGIAKDQVRKDVDDWYGAQKW